jgi:elongation factor Ts
MIDAQDVASLRAETGAGVMDCKRALEDVKGDINKAKQYLAKNAAIAQKKSQRLAKQGIVDSYIHAGRVGVLLELNCETDFVAKNQEFKKLAHDIAMQIASMNPGSIDDLLSQPFIKDESITTSELIKTIIAKTGENIRVNKFIRYELGE